MQVTPEKGEWWGERYRGHLVACKHRRLQRHTITMTFTESPRLASAATVSQKRSVLTASVTVRVTAAAAQNGRGGRAGFLGSNQNVVL